MPAIVAQAQPAMLRLGLTLLLGGISSACGLAALGLLLYGQGPFGLAAAQLFAAVGFVTGLFCGGLHQLMDRRQRLHSAVLPPEALAGLVRATVAGMAAGRASGNRSSSRPNTRAAAAVPVSTAAEPRQFASSAFGA